LITEMHLCQLDKPPQNMLRLWHNMCYFILKEHTMKFPALIFLSLFTLTQSVPGLANTNALHDGGGRFSNEHTKRILLENSPLERPRHNRDKIVGLSLILKNKHVVPLSRKEEREITKMLIPNIDKIRRLTDYDSSNREHFRKILRTCLEDVLIGYRGIGNHHTVARKVSEIIIP